LYHRCPRVCEFGTSDHIRVVTVAGDGGNVESLRTTDEHPFFAQGKGWMGAGLVRPGDRLQAPDGSWQEVLDSNRGAHPGGITVYTFEVEVDHTYFVEDGSGAADAVWNL
jgi:hypothetical protein